MPKKIKVTADTSEVTKSIIDLGRELKKVSRKTSPVSIFDRRERKFIKEELKTALKDMGKQFQANKSAISDLLKEQTNVKKGTAEELKIRKRILTAVKTQAELSKKISDTKTGGEGDGGGGKGFLGGIGGILKKIALGGAIRAGVLAVKANSQFVGSTGDRIRAQGLGMTEGDQNQGTSEELARVGLTRRSLIESRIQATALGSQEAGGQEATLQRAGFERAFGLEQGQMTDVMSQLRPSLGGDESNRTQLKLQASILAAGIEEAVGPYLENMTGLLASINETGMTSTDQLINAFAMLSADGARTPEQLAATFGGIDSSVKGASGERNAMLQMAMANSGIGGGTIGGAQLALESGGIMGLDREEFGERGFSGGMMDTMGGLGLFGGMGEGGGLSARTGGIMDLAREMGGMEEGDSFGDIQDPQQMVMMAKLSNNLLGTSGMQGISSFRLFEDLERGTGGGVGGTERMTREEFEKRQQDIMDSATTPDSNRLDAINDSLSGQTQILRNIQESELDVLGRQLVVLDNIRVAVETMAITSSSGAIDTVSQALEAVGGGDGGGRNQNQGGGIPLSSNIVQDLGSSLYSSVINPESLHDPEKAMSGTRNRANQESSITADEVEKGMTRAYARRKRSDTQKNADVNLTVKNLMPDGSIQNGTLGQ